MVFILPCTLGQSRVNFVVDSPAKTDVLMIFCLEELQLASSSSGSCCTSKDENKMKQETKDGLCRLAQKIQGGSSFPQTFFATSENHLGLILKRGKSLSPHDVSNR